MKEDDVRGIQEDIQESWSDFALADCNFDGFPEIDSPFASLKENEKEKKTMARQEKLSTKVKKQMFLQELRKKLGVIQPAADAVGISRQQVLNWRHKDPEFARAFEEVSEVALDFVETKLLKLIDGMDTTATIFYLKTKGKRRGYVEKQEIEASIEGSVSFEAFLMESTLPENNKEQEKDNG